MSPILTRALIGATALLGCAHGAFAETAATTGAKLPPPLVAETHDIPLKSAAVLGERMTYLELGQGAPVVFVHGNPTSSYLWRNVMPLVAEGAHGQRRAIAVDLIGMGGSSKPDIAYTFEEHYAYFAAFIDALDLERVTLVGHDWGAALSWTYALRNPDRVSAIAYMEGVLPPAFPVPSFEAMGEELGGMFRTFKDPVAGERVVLDQNMFVEQVLPGFVNRPLGPEARAAYGAPYRTRASRRPTLSWPRAIPIAGEPAESVAALEAIAGFMAETELPALLIYAEPGAVIPPQAVAWHVATVRNLETAFVGQGLHYIQEDHPVAIGRALSDWLRRN